MASIYATKAYLVSKAKGTSNQKQLKNARTLDELKATAKNVFGKDFSEVYMTALEQNSDETMGWVMTAEFANGKIVVPSAEYRGQRDYKSLRKALRKQLRLQNFSIVDINNSGSLTLDANSRTIYINLKKDQMDKTKLVRRQVTK